MSEWWFGAEARWQHTSDERRGEWLVRNVGQREGLQLLTTRDKGPSRRFGGSSVLQSP